jgi:hypothetical protein
MRTIALSDNKDLTKVTETTGPVCYEINAGYFYEHKLRTVSKGLQERYSRIFTNMLKQNAIALVDFITYLNTEINLSQNHKITLSQ